MSITPLLVLPFLPMVSLSVILCDEAAVSSGGRSGADPVRLSQTRQSLSGCGPRPTRPPAVRPAFPGTAARVSPTPRRDQRA